MLKLICVGKYSLSQLAGGMSLLILDRNYSFTVKNFGSVPDVLRSADMDLETGKEEESGVYRLYDVSAQPHLTDGRHLELHKGKGIWAAYILPADFPEGCAKSYAIAKSNEVITRVLRFLSEGN